MLHRFPSWEVSLLLEKKCSALNFQSYHQTESLQAAPRHAEEGSPSLPGTSSPENGNVDHANPSVHEKELKNSTTNPQYAIWYMLPHKYKTLLRSPTLLNKGPTCSGLQMYPIYSKVSEWEMLKKDSLDYLLQHKSWAHIKTSSAYHSLQGNLPFRIDKSWVTLTQMILPTL